MFVFDDSVEEIGENGVRKICCGCGGSVSLIECFRFAGSPAISICSRRLAGSIAPSFRNTKYIIM
ncbi:hypothetical protein Hanom_Chr08g00707321 [Helianthus anomalus]